MEWVVLAIIVAVVIWRAIASANAEQKEKERAMENYQRSLAQLKGDPANADLRQKTLKLGRIYSNLMRDKKGNTIFDEVALMNDINAACAATQQVISSNQALPPVADIEERLRRLQVLKEKGLIDDTDYAKRKQELMAQI